MLKDSIRIFQDLIKFIKDLITREINLDFYWKKNLIILRMQKHLPHFEELNG
jgi:hypothetical protein